MKNKDFENIEYKNGKKVLCLRGKKHANMLMDVVMYKLPTGKRKTFYAEDLETAILLLTGNIRFSYEGKKAEAARSDYFKEKPTVLHVAKGVKVTVYAKADSEILVQQTENDTVFESVFYKPEDCRTFMSCKDKWENTAVREVRTVIDYFNAPYSKLVIGEVIVPQGRWWGIVPHSHPQPEVYYYRFDKPQGYGVCFIGDDAYKVLDGSCAYISDGRTHPQGVATGYRLYNIWLIRHFDGNPWTSRDEDPDQVWLHDFTPKPAI